jgi:imidazoleglycerol-phosphate dehydratase/histidinol-phosphatase
MAGGLKRLIFVSGSDLYSSATDAPSGWQLRPLLIPALLRLNAAGYELIATLEPGTPGEAVIKLLTQQGVTFLEVLRALPGDASGTSSLPPQVMQVRQWLAGDELDRLRSVVVGMGAVGPTFAANLGIPHATLHEDPAAWSLLSSLLLDQRRTATVSRVTKETTIAVAVDLDSRGEASQILTGIGFFDHMLEQLARHGGMSFKIDVRGDLHIDEHHTVEDTALALGQALRLALGDRFGIERYGFVLPMDESLVSAAIDLSGRPHLSFKGAFGRAEVGALPTELVPHFFRSFCETLGATLHVEVQGDNAHHMIEGVFKGVARCLRQAMKQGGDASIPSTKGML